MARNPQRNQSEEGTPQASREGVALRVDAVELRGEPTYLPRARVGILGRFGDFQNPGYVSVPVVHRRGYQGLAPLELQVEVSAPPPWEGTVRR
jgi:hypothetical protein